MDCEVKLPLEQGILSAIKGLSTGYGRDLQEIKPKAHADKISLSKLDLMPFREAIRAAIGKNSKNIKSTYVQSVLKSATASASLRKRKSVGSAGFAEQKRMIISRKKLLAKLHKNHMKQEKKLADALNYTSARISKVLK